MIATERHRKITETPCTLASSIGDASTLRKARRWCRQTKPCSDWMPKGIRDSFGQTIQICQNPSTIIVELFFFILVRFSNGIHAIQWLQFFLEYFKGPILSHAHTKCCVNIPQGSIYDLLVIYVCSVLTYSRPFCLVAGFFSKGPPFDFESETFCFGITSLVWGADIGIAPYTCPVSCNGSRKHQTFSGGSSSPWSIVNVCGSMPCQSTWASQFWFVPRLVKLKRPKENTGTQSTRSTMWVVN